MFFKLILIVSFCFHCNVSRADGGIKKIPTTHHESLIVREYLFVGDEANITISNFKVVKDAKMKINVVIDKTLGYNIDPFYPFYSLRSAHQEQQPKNLNASVTINNFFDIHPSSFAFEIDFTKNETSHLHLKPKDYLAQSMVHLYPDIDSMRAHNASLRNQVKLLSKCDIDGEIFYSLRFFLAIEAIESEGLHVLSLNSSEEISTDDIEVLMSVHNFSAMYYEIQLGLYFIIAILAFTVWFRRYRGTKLEELYQMPFLFSCYKFDATLYLLGKSLIPNEKFFGVVLAVAAIFLFVVLCVFTTLAVVCLYSSKRMKIIHWATYQFLFGMLIIHAIGRFFELTDTLPTIFWFSKFTLVAHFVFFMVFVAQVERKYQEKRLEEGTKDGNKFVRILLLLICVIVLIVLAFRLVLASMIWLGLPYYLFWMQFAIEELLYVLYCWFIVFPYCSDAITNTDILDII